MFRRVKARSIYLAKIAPIYKTQTGCQTSKGGPEALTIENVPSIFQNLMTPFTDVTTSLNPRCLGNFPPIYGSGLSVASGATHYLLYNLCTGPQALRENLETINSTFHSRIEWHSEFTDDLITQT